jgi:PhnB protein
MPNLVPYLIFNGNCEEAMNFYKTVFGGEFAYLGRYSQNPGEIPEEYKNRILHIALDFFGGSLYASDAEPGTLATLDPALSGIWLSMEFSQADELDRCYSILSEEGTIIVPLQDTFWGNRFAKVRDKYGFSWMLIRQKRV